MTVRRRLVALSLGAAGLLAALHPRSPVSACAPAPHSGESVSISGEAALIVWDPASKTEHFVRRADFRTKASDFGFLVPTPSPPDLGEVDESLFRAASRLTQARHGFETRVRKVFGFGNPPQAGSMADMAPSGAKPASAPPVEVLHEQEVAGFDATVLRADDPKALTDWLGEHGYESRPALVEWLRWYTDHGWIITAFKLTSESPGSGRLDARSVRMSFHTDRPFYPYREPGDMRKPGGGSRSLRVFFLSDKKYEGTLGEAGKWPGTTEWAGDISGMARNLTEPLKLADAGSAKTLEAARYLTEFQDDSSPRPGTDEVYFRPAADPSGKERPPIVHTTVVVEYWPGPWGLVGVVALVALSALAIVALVVLRRA